MQPTPQMCLYATPNPVRYISEVYFSYTEQLETAKDPKECWVLMEEHGWFDDAVKKFQINATTLNPSPQHGVGLDEVHRLTEKQISLRVKQGFKYLFDLDPFGPPWYKQYEILPNGTWRAMP
jgi:hypothetical protein